MAICSSVQPAVETSVFWLTPLKRGPKVEIHAPSAQNRNIRGAGHRDQRASGRGRHVVNAGGGDSSPKRAGLSESPPLREQRAPPPRPTPFPGTDKERASPAAPARGGRAGMGLGGRPAVGPADAAFAPTVLGADRLPGAAVSEYGQRPLHLGGGVHVECQSHRGEPASGSLRPAAARRTVAATAWNGPCEAAETAGNTALPARPRGRAGRKGGEGGERKVPKSRKWGAREGGFGVFAQLESD